MLAGNRLDGNAAGPVNDAGTATVGGRQTAPAGQ